MGRRRLTHCACRALQTGPRSRSTRPSCCTSSARTRACHKSFWQAPQLVSLLALAIEAAQPQKVGLGVAEGLCTPVKAAWASLAGCLGKPRRTSDWPAWHLAGCEGRPILRVQTEPRERTWAPCLRRRAGCWRPRDWTAVSINKPSSLVTSFYILTELEGARPASQRQTRCFWRYLRLEAVSPPTQFQLIWENWSATILVC